jgi:hypothetical protein
VFYLFLRYAVMQLADQAFHNFDALLAVVDDFAHWTILF